MVTRNFQLGRETHKFIGKKIGQENRGRQLFLLTSLQEVGAITNKLIQSSFIKYLFSFA